VLASRLDSSFTTKKTAVLRYFQSQSPKSGTGKFLSMNRECAQWEQGSEAAAGPGEALSSMKFF
jgi:hypothetical protein